ncbi:PepSY domain-containing protein [Methanolobus sp.]|uniref:PepSY domain-containing protein n=1 Tax=Methanolobus sp. TaxID=1874737 RepID=UPI0025E7A44B|nr:PepSY domain-containing protein [Methanolobus sp.]
MGDDGQDIQEPAYTSSVVVPDDSSDEAQETQDLTKYPVISQTVAETAALNEVTGELGEVELDNENGNLVYSVEIATSEGVKDVKVDAGNGNVLFIENDDQDETDEIDSDDVEFEDS